jgi:hypothetical protein
VIIALDPAGGKGGNTLVCVGATPTFCVSERASHPLVIGTVIYVVICAVIYAVIGWIEVPPTLSSIAVL